MSNLLLSTLKPGADISEGTAGTWNIQQRKAFQDLATSLQYNAPGEMKNVSAVPTMWARPLIMETALHEKNHPLRKQMVSQWQGMLAAIALAEVWGFPLKAQLVDLNNYQDNKFGKALYDLMPKERVNLLYTLQNTNNPWSEIYIFLWNEQPVGMSTPSTLVCPSETGNWKGLPWWNERLGMLEEPHNKLNENDKQMLCRWLENIKDNIGNYGGKRDGIDRILRFIEYFQTNLGVNKNKAPSLSLSDEPQFFGVALNRGALTLLNKPIKMPPQPSNVKLVRSKEKTSNAKDLIIIDKNITQPWGVPAQTVWVHGGKTLASLKIEDLRNGTIVWEDVRWIESKDLFYEEFYFIDQEKALPGAILPQIKGSLVFNGETITPLLPINKILLDYFTPEELIKLITLEAIQDGEGNKIRVTLDLPLTGMNKNDNKPQNFRLYKEYLLREENAIKYLPVLQLWPNFRANEWKEYYGFYYDGGQRKETFQVSFPNQRELKEFEEKGGNYQLVRFEEFPSYILCQDSHHNTIAGLIILPTPVKETPTGSWSVGVDFGTSFTNVYVNNGEIESLPMDNLQLMVTESEGATRLPVLFSYFIPEKFIPEKNPLPLATILTTQGSPQNNQQMRSIFDGRISVIGIDMLNIQNDWIKTNLKWGLDNLQYNQIFLRNLALYISAQAAKNGISKIDWCLSYPSAFSNTDTAIYHKVWDDISKELQGKTGINYSCPLRNDVNRFQTESLALAQYFSDYERQNFVSAACIDMGGGTSDISIWENNNLCYQCSIQYAGRDIFSQFLYLTPQFTEKLKLFGNSNIRNIDRFNAAVDIALRYKSEEILQKDRVFMGNDPNFQGLIQLIGLGVAGLYYYVGMILKILNEQKIYQSGDIPPVYLGGNGSRFLHWLMPTGKFDQFADVNKLFSRMLSLGSGFEDIQQKTVLSQNPKHEVAYGLVVQATNLSGARGNTNLEPIAGDKCQVSYVEDNQAKTKEIKKSDRLVLEGQVTNFVIPEIISLKQFLYDYHIALRELKIQNIQPIQNYQVEPVQDNDQGRNNQNSQLWRDVKRNITNTTNQIRGNALDMRVEPPFILELKSLLIVLGDRWAQGMMLGNNGMN